MTEQWATIVVSLVTGVFGIGGIIITQHMAKLKTRQISPSANDIIAASEGYADKPRLDYLALIKQDLQSQCRTLEDISRNIRDGIRDIRNDIRHEADDIKRDLDRIDRK